MNKAFLITNQMSLMLSGLHHRQMQPAQSQEESIPRKYTQRYIQVHYLWFLQAASDLHLSVCQLILNYAATANSGLM